MNTVVLCEQLVKDQSLQSVAWFHYSGESQSRRFLVLTSKGSVKLYSFFFEKLASKDRYMGKSNELSLLYIYRKRVTRDFSIRSHDFANFIFFSPGIQLYMVDFYPIVYYPAVTSQLTHTFESLIPNDKKEVYWQSDFIFISGVEVKKISHEIHTVVSLQSILEYAELKILKMDYRPKFYDQTDILLNKPLSYKILISYYFGSMVRSLVLSRICFNNPTAEETV